jgi:HlyD family secretion protein
MKKRLLVAGGFVVTVVAAAIALRGGGVDVTVATVERDTLSVTIAAEGYTRARDRFSVAAPITGRLTRLDLEVGQVVEEGALIARIFPAPEDPRALATARAEVSAAEARFQEAQARVREAELQARQAEREAERRRPLLEMGAITRERMEQAELAAEAANERLDSAEAGLATARASLEAARARLLGSEGGDEGVQPVDVNAPVSGRVVAVPDESERVIAAGAPIVELAGAGGLEVVLDVLSEDAVQVDAGNPVVVSGWGGEAILWGKVRTVPLVAYTEISALGVEEQRVDVIADLEDPPASLGTGYRVSADIVVWAGSDVLVVPTSSVFRSGDSWQVFVVEEGRARRRNVVLGHRNEQSAEIVEGLSEGEDVVVFPPEDVEEGTEVVPADGRG